MSDWKIRLLVTSTGAPRPLLANAITALREAPAWFNGRGEIYLQHQPGPIAGCDLNRGASVQ
jgi:hypothetical protein